MICHWSENSGRTFCLKHVSIVSKVDLADEKGRLAAARLTRTSSTSLLRHAVFPFSSPVLCVVAGAIKRQNRIGSRDQSAAISGSEVGQAERNRERCMLPMISVACSGLCPFTPEKGVCEREAHHPHSDLGDGQRIFWHTSSNLRKNARVNTSTWTVLKP